MGTRTIVLAVACSALAFGCAAQRDSAEETREIIDNLSEAGFPSEEQYRTNNLVSRNARTICIDRRAARTTARSSPMPSRPRSLTTRV